MWSVWLVFCDGGFHSVFPLKDKNKRLMEASWWERLTVGKLGLVLLGRALLSKSLIQFSVDGWGGCVLPCCLSWNQTVVEVMKIMVTSFKRYHAHTAALLHSVPWPCSRSPRTHASAGNSWTLTGKSGSMSCGVTIPFSWVLVHTRFCLCPLRVCFPSPV